MKDKIDKKFDKRFDRKIDKKYIPLMIAPLIVIVSVIVFGTNPAFLGNAMILALLVGIVPYILFSYFEYQRIKTIEDQLPLFLLDLAETQKTGVTISEAFHMLSASDYSSLTPEIKIVSDQISWGLTVEEALMNMANRLKKSQMVKQVARIIIEANRAGGDLIKTIETTANDLLALREIEKDKRAMLFQQVMVMYAIYFIFIAIIISLSKTLIPMLQINTSEGGLAGIFVFQDPCLGCPGQAYCIACSLYGATCSIFPQLGTGAGCYYRSLFLLMAIVQGIFSGLVAGQIGENSVVAGAKHSLIMTLSGFAIIIILLFLGQM